MIRRGVVAIVALALAGLWSAWAAVQTGAAVSATEGQPFSGQVATVNTNCDKPSSPEGTIDWGDGSSSPARIAVLNSELIISGSHTYGEEGGFAGGASGSFTCPTGPAPVTESFSAQFTAQVVDAGLQASGQPATATVGQSLTAILATFTDADPGGTLGDYSATVDWGDGSTNTAGTITATPGGGFQVTGTHSYGSVGGHTATITIRDAGGASATVAAPVTVTGAAPTISVSPGSRFAGTLGSVIATCLAPGSESDAVGTVRWGDGQSSPARVTISGSRLELGGAHVYENAGTYNGLVTGSYQCGTQTVTISPIAFTGVIQLFNVVDLRAQGIDVTQGILNDNGLLVPSGGASGDDYEGMTWSPPDCCNDPLPNSSPLAAYNWTVVRVYADAHGAPPGGLPGVSAELYGYRDGVPLPGSPLFADYGPASLPDTGEPDPAPVFTAERTSDANAFTFTLPQSWTSGTISLTAKLIAPPPSSSGLITNVVCATQACQANQSFTLNQITFNLLPYVVIAPVAMVRPGEPPLPDPFQLYSNALRTEPNASGYVVLPYVATVDPTQVIDNPYAYDPSGDQNNGYLQLLEDFAGFYYFGVPAAERPNIISAVNEDQRGVTVGSIYNYPSPAFDLVNVYRPLTSVAHETGHALGRNHADDSAANGQADGTGSTGCGGAGGPWPPDGRGYMQGIGLDSSTHPYKILYPGLPGEPAHFYDKMSYCYGAPPSEPTGDGCWESCAWTSPFGWLHSISALYVFGQRTGRARDVPAAVPPAIRDTAGVGGAAGDPSRGGYLGITAGASSDPARGGYLAVTAVVDAKGATIGPAVPSSGAISAPSNSDFKLVTLDRAGRPLASANLFAQTVHDDPGASYTDLIGTVPARGAVRLQLVENGVVLATRSRPPHVPRVRIFAPRRGQRIGGRNAVLVRWRASDADHLPLFVAVDYSANGGRSWRTVYVGPSRGHARLPSFYFARSGDARLRVRASDGFNEGIAISARLISLGAPPQAVILAPSRGARIAGDGRLELSGSAFDQQLRELGGRRLEWFDGPVRLGYGAALSAGPLPPGMNRIRLVARDESGQMSSVGITVVVVPLRLPFLRLKLPRRAGVRARQLTFLAGSAVPATLTVDRRRFRLTRRARRFSLPIGRGPLLLELTVSENRATFPFAALVARG